MRDMAAAGSASSVGAWGALTYFGQVVLVKAGHSRLWLAGPVLREGTSPFVGCGAGPFSSGPLAVGRDRWSSDGWVILV